MNNFFDNYKKNLEAKTTDELFEKIGELCIQKNWPIGDSDPLGVVVGDYYYCLGDPSSTLPEMINQKTTKHKIIWGEEKESDFEKIVCDGKKYWIDV